MRKFFSIIIKYTDEISLTVIGVFIYFAAGGTQSGWLYYILALILALMALGFIIPRLSLMNIEITRDAAPMCYEDDEITITLHVRNNSSRWRPFIYLREHLPSQYFSGEPERLFPLLSLAPGEERNITYTVKCRQRGIVTFSCCEVGCSYPFGLFAAFRRVRTEHFLTIFPRGPHIEKMGLLPSSFSTLLFGQHRTLSIAGRSFDFMGIREYSPFDGTRFIHWPSTARLGKLMVKEFNDASQTRLILVVDAHRTSSMGEGRENTLEYSVKAAASIVEYAYRSRIPLTLLSGAGDDIHILPRPAKFQMLQYLSSLSSSCSLLPGQMVERYLAGDAVKSSLSGQMIILQSVPIIDKSVFEALRLYKISASILFFEGSSFSREGGSPYDRSRYNEAESACAELGIPCSILRKGDNLKDILESDVS